VKLPTGETIKRFVDIVSGLSVIATMVFIALQWNEMKTGGADTHDLAVAAKSQADAAKSQADNTRVLDNAAVDQVAKLDAGVKESHSLVKSSQETLREAQANFIREQRPYMWVEPQPPKFEVGKQLFWDVLIINYGKSPAINAEQCIFLIYGLSDVRRDLTASARDTMCAAARRDSTQGKYIAAPGAKNFITVHTNGTLTEDAVRKVRDQDYMFGVIGTISYYALTGHHYTSDFCFTHYAGGGLPACDSNNEIR
jgi:hypothetical protein